MVTFTPVIISYSIVAANIKTFRFFLFLTTKYDKLFNETFKKILNISHQIVRSEMEENITVKKNHECQSECGSININE